MNNKKAKSQRQLQLGEQIKRILAEIFITDNLVQSKNIYITILEADLSPDAKNAKIYVDIFGQVDDKTIIRNLNDLSSYFRKKLSGKISLRFTPELKFILDKTGDSAAKIEELLKNEGKKIGS